MCFILATNQVKPNHLEVLATAWNSNSNGAGISAFRDGRLIMMKPFMSCQHFLKNAERLMGLPAVFHLRLATHGTVNGANCHPFWTCKKKALLCHNGIMPMPWAADRTYSDSRKFAESLMGFTMEEVIASKYKLESTIGHNKVVIMDQQGNVFIMNPELGYKYEPDTWCSCNPGWMTSFARPFAGTLLPSRLGYGEFPELFENGDERIINGNFVE